ncbi:MAG TPA: bifunctional acetate--CoA ligase family protein/GNAT family N-acetyltransferase [Planctomycetota bacterium]|jgi:acetyltransferase
MSEENAAPLNPGEYIRLQQPLRPFFNPRGVAVVGATEKEGSVGRTVLQNLIRSTFGGTVYPVNPKRPSILGIKAYPTVGDIKDAIDLAVVVTPAPACPAVIKECVDLGIKNAVIISAGFKEIGAPGVELERQIAEIAKNKMRIVGPNCLGLMNPLIGFNATFANDIAKPGNVALISQSGALCTAILDWSLKNNIGFSCFVSTGSMLDVTWGDLIYYLGDDPNTKSIVIYMESVGDARAFISAAREIALTKPIICIKAGRTEAAAKAASSHTGSLAGSDAVLDAAFSRCGVLRVNTIADMFYMADVLGKQPRPAGNKLSIITNAGGPGVLATDALVSNGGELAPVSKASMETLNTFLPSAWSHGNPIDVLGDADAERYVRAYEIAAADPDTDGVLMILTPQAMTDPTACAEKLRNATKLPNKPLLTSWMGGECVANGQALLARSGIPMFPYPDTAARMFTLMSSYSKNLKRLYETPQGVTEWDGGVAAHAAAEKIINSVMDSGRDLLTEVESKDLLAAYGIPTVPTKLATDEDAAARLAQAIGYPVVLKLYSYTITHKTDVGGVVLNLQNADEVRKAYKQIEKSVKEKAGAEHFQGVTVQPMAKLDGYEIILGCSLDVQFGPVLLFGLGGQLVEVFKDSALALPPLTTTLARQMMERTKIYTALKGVRGRQGVDLQALENIMVRFSQLVVDQPRIKEIDINPMLASPKHLIALDARVVLHDKKTPDAKLPKAAIRAYPTQYVSDWKLKDGSAVTIRPIRPEDEPAVVKFHQGLSDQTVRNRYFRLMNLDERVAHSRLQRICFIDYDREMALIIERKNETGAKEAVAIGRLSKLRGQNMASLHLLVTDKFQGRGVGRELMRRLLQVARDEKLERVIALVLPESKSMIQLCESFGFVFDKPSASGSLPIKCELKL